MAGLEPILALMPESKATYTLDKNLRPVFAELPTAADAATTRLAYVVIATLTSVSTTALATTLFQHGLTTGDSVVISGATETEYNGTYTITVISAQAFTYTFAGSGTTPATGTITAEFPVVSDDELAITVCPAKDGGVWVLYDALAGRGFLDSLAPILRKFDPATGELIADVVRPFTALDDPPISIGELGSYKSLMDIGCGRLLTNNRTTHQVIAIQVESVPDGLIPVDPDVPIIDNSIGTVAKMFNLYVDPLDAAVNAAATRLLYINGDSVCLWDLEEDEFIRTIVAGIECSDEGGGTGGGGGLHRCTQDCTGTTPDASALPSWFYDALVALGATGCVDESLMDTDLMKNACWDNGYAIQVGLACNHRARLYQQGVTFVTNFCGDRDNGNYSHIVNLTASDGCSWAFLG